VKPRTDPVPEAERALVSADRLRLGARKVTP